MKNYVLGFCFSPDLSRVVLIDKKRSCVPEHVGSLNGVGGHVEQGEDPMAAMAREFREEAGYQGPVEWVEFARLSAEDYVVRVFRASSDLPRRHHHETEEGRVSCYPAAVLLIPENHVHLAPDLPWLVPMALQHLRGRGPRMYDIWQGSGKRAPGAGDPCGEELVELVGRARAEGSLRTRPVGRCSLARGHGGGHSLRERPVPTSEGEAPGAGDPGARCGSTWQCPSCGASCCCSRPSHPEDPPGHKWECPGCGVAAAQKIYRQGPGERAPGAGGRGPGGEIPGKYHAVVGELSPVLPTRAVGLSSLLAGPCDVVLRTTTGAESAERAPGAGDPGPGTGDQGASTGQSGVVTGVGGRVLGTCELVGAVWPVPSFRESERRGPGDEVLERLGHALQEDLTLRVVVGPARIEDRAIPVEVESSLRERGKPTARRLSGPDTLPEVLRLVLDDVWQASRPRSEWADIFRRRP